MCMFRFRFSILAPAKIRPGTKQNILIEGQNMHQLLKVTIQVYDFPVSETVYLQDSVILKSDNNYSALKTIEIDPNVLRPDGKKKYVKLVAQFGPFHRAEEVIAVSFRTGHIFIQTDKPVYNPGDAVRCRAFVSDSEFRASERTISLEIQNPDGIAVHGMSRAKSIDGILSDTYLLSTVVKEGKWKVVAKFDQGKENIFSREFEVKKYVLPAFNVTLTPKTSHLGLDADKLEVEITARYLYGEPVQGVAYVLFGIEINGEKKRLTSMKQLNDLNGGIVSLTMEEIKRAYPDTNSLVGSSVYVKASVMTSTGSDLVEAEKSGIKIVISPYMLSIRDTPKYFKPGLPFGMTVTVSNHDGSPAPNIPVKISFLESPISDHHGIIQVYINMPNTARSFGESQILKVETANPSLRPEQQAVLEVHVEPYAPFSGHRNFLHISVGLNKVAVGDGLNVQAHIKSPPNQKKLVEQLTYAVLNKGNIIHAGRVNVKDLAVINIPLLVTAEMLPSFRIVAYYILPWISNAEVVADSVFVDVEDRCVGSLSVGPVKGEKHNSYSPGSSFKFDVKGDPGAKVSLVAVDNAVFLLSKNRLTQKKVWEVVGQGDMGCTSGGGKNNMGVFSDAGLMFYSSTGRSTDYKKDCSSKSRRRRSAAKLQLKEQLEKVYSDEFLQRCCVDGMREIPMPYSCYRRSLYITEDWSCVLAFLHCCAQYRGEELGVVTRPPTTTLPPTTTPTPTTSHLRILPMLIREETFRDYLTGSSFSDRVEVSRFVALGSPVLIGLAGGRMESHVERMKEKVEEEEEEQEFNEDDLADIEDIYVRTKFFESWLWTDIRLPSVPKSDGLAVFSVDTVLPDSITQWGFLAVSASPEKGFCVAEPYNVRAWQPFFIDLRLPHSVSRNEHVQIKAVVHNYRDSKLEVLVILDKTEDMCSVAFSGPHRQQVSVQAGSSKLITYTIIPLKTGELPLQVTAIAASFMGQDAVRKNLRVVVEGIQTIKVRSFVLNPTGKGDSAGRQMIEVEKMQLDAVVPKSLPETFVNVRGDLLADSIDNSIQEDSLASLIRMPGGCVEQNLATITLPLIAAHYLDRSANWAVVGVSRREEAIKYIQKGYENQLNYRKTDDSYPPYAKEGTSTWVTAYVVKVFSMAHSFIRVDKKHLCGPLLYLLKNKHSPDGSFQENNPVYDTSMTGGLRGSESRVSLTAFVLIALAEAQNAVTCQEPGLDIQDESRKAATYIREHFPRLSRPYTAAIACYALAVSNHGCMKSMLLKLASPDRTHWPDSDNYFFTLEATGYALLALIKSGHMEEAAAPFQWLSEKRGIGGGYGSTQSTMVVLQALSEYLVKSPPPTDLNLLVQLSVPGRSDVRWTFNPKVAYVARSSRVPLDQEFTVVASGKGKGILEVVTVYHQLPDVFENSTCNGFQLDVSIAETNEKNPPDVEKSYRLNIHVRALEARQVRMVILDIGLPTGFEPENSDLELLKNSVDRYINNYQVVDNLSDRGSLIIHLFKVSSTDTDMISFRLHQKFKVGLLQPSTVTVYQYYNKDKRCSRFYSPPEDQQQLDQICKDDVCRCSQGDCCVVKEDSLSFGKEQRKAAVCNGLHHGKSFFFLGGDTSGCHHLLNKCVFSSAYRVTLISASQSHYDQYEMEIVQVIKEGTEEGLIEKERRMFLSHASCRTGLGLREGQDYLIIGPIADVWQAGSTSNRYVYTLGKDTWVERWPAVSECGAGSPLQVKCDELKSFATALTESGCQS
ncbi:complement component c3b, tandem duplicate 2 isoform X1 [Rhinichthys klamathensis goyatoka]|uniref:complement component c3b, tandem duplicate 2 isoform X1 n=1 Tax=Rhinichthys klamathensis goyatoka TaxID=3034132 RepID=UPI0024B617A7|nr:complement component c3b, tandem duplicate 2 isoform X1 [Rhinichthys klamathensis goyatoka]